MKKYSFRLQKVLHVRSLQEGIAKSELLAANRALAEAEAHQLRRLDEYRAIPTEGAAGAARFLAARSLRGMAATVAIDAIARRDIAAGVVEERRGAWREAERRVETLERLQERQRIEWAHGIEKERERLVDDLVAAKRIRSARDADRGTV